MLINPNNTETKTKFKEWKSQTRSVKQVQVTSKALTMGRDERGLCLHEFSTLRSPEHE